MRWRQACAATPPQISKGFFRAYVFDNFYAIKAAAMPILYKIAQKFGNTKILM
jgi:hypothetical protein